MARREEKKQESREKLLAAAAECFAEKGFSGCSVADIAHRADVAQGGMYVHFKNKEALFIAMLEEEHRQGAEKVRLVLETSPDLDGIIGILESCIRDVGFPVDHRLWTEILAVSARDPSIREAFVVSDKAMRSVFVTLLRKAAEAGGIDNTLDFDAVSVWLYALVDGLIARAANDPNFDFQKCLTVFELLIRKALGPRQG